MAAVRIVIGLVFVIAGLVAITDRDLTDGAWWLLATAAGVIGVVALTAAFRP